MRFRKLAIILTIIEIISFLFTMLTIYTPIKYELFNDIRDFSSFWNIPNTIDIPLVDLITIYTNKISIIIFILVSLIRFIFIKFELKMIYMASVVMSIGMLVIYFTDVSNLLLMILTILCLTISVVGIAYTHIIVRSN